MVGKKEVEQEKSKEAAKFNGTELVSERKAFPL
jgi:hypothetical protein